MAALTAVFVPVKPDGRRFGPDLRRELGKVDVGPAGRQMGGNLSKSTAGGFRSKIGGLARSMFAPLAAAATGVGIFNLFKDAIGEAREAQKTTAQTGAVIKSTGGAANVSASQVSKLATAISNKVGVDDEAIQSGANLLLTFTNIRNEAGRGNDIFNQSTQVITDMSAALGQDMKSSAIQVGKALNDPIKGVTALQRVGVSFTADQKEQIKTLVESGRTMDAQKLILAELNKEFGGSAAATATAGEKLRVVFANGLERVGTAMLPMIDRTANLAAEWIPRLIDGLIDAGAWLVKGARWMNDNRMAVTILAGAMAALVTVTKLHGAVLAVQGAGGLLKYLAATKLVTTATKTWTAVQWLLNTALTANPIGIVIGLAVALGAAFVILWQRSETFRKVVTGAFNGFLNVVKGAWNWIKQNWPTLLAILTGPIGLAVLSIVKNWDKIRSTARSLWEGLQNIWRTGVRTILNVFFGLVQGVLDGAAKAFGWIPGLGDKLKNARDRFKTFRENVNKELGAIRNKSITISGQADIKMAGKAVYVNGVRVAGTNFAEGGLWNHERHVAQIARGGSWRLWAEDETGGEAYIPLAASKRGKSTKILETVAHMFGYQLEKAADGAIFNVNTSLPVKPWRDTARRFNRLAETVGYVAALVDAAGSGYSPGVAGALRWARSQDGKPYLWGGVGPRGYDCSGIWSALVNVIQGRSPYTRRFSTGTLPAGLFTPGIGPAMVGWFRGNPGHMAGTLNGVNVESAGGVGVRVGGRARGARDRMFNGPWRLKSYDTGGWVPPGPFAGYNGTGRPEYIDPNGPGGGMNVLIEVSSRDARVPELALALRKVARMEAQDVLREYTDQQRRGGRA